MKAPAVAPCVSCPYRRDVPSGVWAAEEYAKLPGYDLPTWEQPPGVFLCHQRDERVCAGWAAVHGDEHALALRLAVATGLMPEALYAEIVDYETDVPLFGSGAEAATHGLAEIERPRERAVRVIQRIERKRA